MFPSFELFRIVPIFIQNQAFTFFFSSILWVYERFVSKPMWRNRSRLFTKQCHFIYPSTFSFNWKWNWKIFFGSFCMQNGQKQKLSWQHFAIGETFEPFSTLNESWKRKKSSLWNLSYLNVVDCTWIWWRWNWVWWWLLSHWHSWLTYHIRLDLLLPV